MTTIMGSNQIEEGHGPATITLPQGTTIGIISAIYAPNATRNLTSFKDIRENGYHVHTSTNKDQEVLHIVQNSLEGIEIKETLFSYPLGFYVTTLQNFHLDTHRKTMTEIWQYRLGHPEITMFQKMIKVTRGIPPNIHVNSLLKRPCLACSKGKLVIRPSTSKTIYEMPKFLERLHANVCGPIDPPNGPFRFFS